MNRSPTMAIGGPGGGTGVWRKVLWEESGYPDHYTPPGTFLAAMKRNQNLVLYTRAQTLAGAAQVLWTEHTFLGSV